MLPMLRITFRSLLFLLLLFVVPALAHVAVWSITERPSSWREATWSSAGILPKSPNADQAEIYLMSARTGGFKGAFATHTWLVLKPKGASRYDRYDVVGWGAPVRKNAYPADGYWYSNQPEINHKIVGDEAHALIPRLERAIATYRWRQYGDYTIWPGPNSNTFIASILRQVPEVKAFTPSTAVGRNFPADGKWIGHDPNGDLFVTLGGYLGLAIGPHVGFEMNFLGLVLGVNPRTRELKIPAFGNVQFL